MTAFENNTSKKLLNSFNPQNNFFGSRNSYFNGIFKERPNVRNIGRDIMKDGNRI